MISFESTFLLEGSKRSSRQQVRIHLGGFGKHPGWDDHIEGLGMDTESMALVQQLLYHGGIGDQIDSGVWDKLEPDQRLAAFHHIFSWQRGDQVIVGRLWASRDGKGRSQYPMGVCAHCVGVSFPWVVRNVLPALEKLQSECQSRQTADEVRAAVQTHRNRLNRLLGGFLADAATRTPAEIAQGRAEVDISPEGLVRVLYQVRSQLAAFAPTRGLTLRRAANPRPQHLRVPADSQRPLPSLVFWNDLLRTQLGARHPILLITPLDGGWVDVVTGEPTPHEFFCLKAGLSAMPLVSDVPFNFTSEFEERAGAIIEGFLGAQPVPSVLGDGTETSTATEPVGPGGANRRAEDSAASTSGGSGWGIRILGAVLVIALLVVGFVFYRGCSPDGGTGSTRHTLNLAVTPPDAELSLSANGRVIFSGPAPSVIREVPTGVYEARLRREGYLELRTNLTVGASGPETVMLTLQRPRGGIVIHDDLEDRHRPFAQYQLEDHEGAVVPVEVQAGGVTNSLAAGSYQLILRLEGMAPLRRAVTVEAAEVTRVDLSVVKQLPDLDLKVEPAGARVQVFRGGTAGEQPVLERTFTEDAPVLIADLVPGPYVIQARCDGFETLQTNIDLAVSAMPPKLELSLVPNQGFLILEDDLDTWQRGFTRFWLEDGEGRELAVKLSGGGVTNAVQSGVYQVVGQIEGYEPGRLAAAVRVREAVRVDLPLGEALPQLQVTAEPADAHIVLLQEGRQRLAGPAGNPIRNVLPGDYELRVIRDGYDTVITNLTVANVRALETLNVTLRRSYGGLVVTDELDESARGFARYWLETVPSNNQRFAVQVGGTTNRLPAGPYELALQLGGSAPLRRPLLIEPNQVDRMTVSLVSNGVSLTVNPTPPDAVIRLAQSAGFVCKVRGSAPMENLSPGDYELRVTRSGYTPVVTNIIVRAGLPQQTREVVLPRED